MTGPHPTSDSLFHGLSRLDDAWQRLEARLCAAVLVAEIASLAVWISLKGLSTDFIPGANSAGLVYRCMVSAASLGVAAHLATRKCTEGAHRAAVLVAVVAGLASGRFWAHLGVGWSSNVLNWLQNASTLMLIGGLRGLATRLTLWLALLGASLATSRGKHIQVDLAARYLSPRMRARTAVVGWVAAAIVCVAAVFGFADYIVIAQYRVLAAQPCPGDPSTSCDTPAREKIGALRRSVAADFFLLGRQASLDSRSLPRVLAGRPYDRWMTGTEWNAWLDGANWREHFDERAVEALRVEPSAASATTRMPQVAVPGTGEQAHGLLIRELNFVFPFGLGVIAAKLLLRALLVAAGRVDQDAEVLP
jgi:TRAP-type C4-dicarboxylate transport system permease small subunit